MAGFFLIVPKSMAWRRDEQMISGVGLVRESFIAGGKAQPRGRGDRPSISAAMTEPDGLKERPPPEPKALVRPKRIPEGHADWGAACSDETIFSNLVIP